MILLITDIKQTYKVSEVPGYAQIELYSRESWMSRKKSGIIPLGNKVTKQRQVSNLCHISVYEIQT